MSTRDELLSSAEALRKKHASICLLLDDDDTLSVFTLKIFAEGIIEGSVKNTILRKKGQYGADTLVSHITTMVKQQPALFDKVLEAMECQIVLKKVAGELRKMTGHKQPQTKPQPLLETDSSDIHGLDTHTTTSGAGSCGSSRDNEAHFISLLDSVFGNTELTFEELYSDHSEDEEDTDHQSQPVAVYTGPPKSPRTVLKDNFASICDLVTNPTKLGNDLCQAKLITDTVLDNVKTNQSLNRYQQVDRYIKEIRNHVQKNPNSHETVVALCSVLKKQKIKALDAIAQSMLAELGREH